MKKVILIKHNKGILRKISKTYQVNNLLTEKTCRNLSVAVSKAKNHKEVTKNIKSDRVYYILKGKLSIGQNDKKYVAQKGDIILIPKSTNYQFQGTFQAVLINVPAFNARYERIDKIDNEKIN